MISFRKTILTAAALTALLLPFNAFGRVVKVQPVAFDEVRMGGELRERVERNFRRLEEEKYQPDHVFLTEAQSNDWPGDTEGRTILALVLDAQAGRLQPRIHFLVEKYLKFMGKMLIRIFGFPLMQLPFQKRLEPFESAKEAI